uniref:Secreted protein n=1 Tax=Angiostrongylus cantonensis TaxID=6313 RepID=A0A0K0CTI5_ANGCA
MLSKVCSRCPTLSDVAVIPCMVPEARVANNEVNALSLDGCPSICPSVGSPPAQRANASSFPIGRLRSFSQRRSSHPGVARVAPRLCAGHAGRPLLV